MRLVRRTAQVAAALRTFSRYAPRLKLGLRIRKKRKGADTIGRFIADCAVHGAAFTAIKAYIYKVCRYLTFISPLHHRYTTVTPPLQVPASREHVKRT